MDSSTKIRIEKVTNMISESIDLLDADNREQMISDLLSIIRKYIPRMEASLNVSKYPDGLLHVSAAIYHCEDAEVNGENDIDDRLMKSRVNANMPCMRIEDGNYYWEPIIDIAAGRIINWEEGKYANVYYKVVDECYLRYQEPNGTQYDYQRGYVPDFLSPDENGYGDYMYMNINEDGFIMDWNDNEAKKFVESNLLKK